MFRDFNPSRITAHPKVLEYYQKIDPTLGEFSNQGEEELKEFMHRRRYPEKYAREIEEEKRKKREVFLRQEVERLQKIRESMQATFDLCKAGVSVMEEHSYSKTASIEKTNESVIDLTGDSPIVTSKHVIEKTAKNALTPPPQNISTPILNAKFTHITQPFTTQNALCQQINHFSVMTPQKVIMAANHSSTSASQISESLNNITFATPGTNNNVRCLNLHPTVKTPVKLLKLDKECIDTSPGNSKYVKINGQRLKLISLDEIETPIKCTSRVSLSEKSLFEACNSNSALFNRQITELYESGKASRSSTTKTKPNQSHWEDKTQSLNESNPSNINSKLNQSSSNEQVNITHMSPKELPKSNGQLAVGSRVESCPVTALEEAEEKLRLCKLALAELESQKKTSERENNDMKHTKKKEIQIFDNTTLPYQLNINTGRSSTDSGFYEETCGGEEYSKLQKTNTQNTIDDENIALSNVLFRDCGGNMTSVVQSDPEELFDNNFDVKPERDLESNQNSSAEKRKQSEVTEQTPKIRRSSRNRKRKYFDDFITSDIGNAKKSLPKDSLNIRNKSFNKENENVRADAPDSVSKNVGKVTHQSVLPENRKVENWKAFQFENSFDTSTSKLSPSGYTDRQIKQLLADKQGEIDEKRRKALERRLSSLKRSQNSCK